MPALRIQMHLHGNPSPPQCNVVNQRVINTVDGIILSLQQKGRRGLVSYRNIRIQLKFLIGNPQMSRIKGHREIRAAANFVGGIDSRIQRSIKVRTDRYRATTSRPVTRSLSFGAPGIRESVS